MDLKIDRRLQLILTSAGSFALIAYWRSWNDIPHLVYDIPSAIVMCAYLAQIVCEGFAGAIPIHWWSRVILILPVAVIAMGREFLDWNISGHLTGLGAVSLIQTNDRRLSIQERIFYWVPIPFILYIRWFIFDRNGHTETYNAAAVAVTLAIIHYAVVRFYRENPEP